MRIVATIEARMRSSRLPGKVLKPILGRPMLELMIERLQCVGQLDAIVVATTSHPSCDRIEDLATRLGVKCFRGSEDDVLDRVLKAAKYADADVIVETTGDCPLIDPTIVSYVISEFVRHDVDYCSNTLQRSFPRGMDVQIVPRVILEQVAQLTTNPVDREHVSCYIYEHPDRFRLLNVAGKLPAHAAHLRLTVDTPEDFALVTRVFESLYPTKRMFTLNDILKLFESQPELADINGSVRQKAIR